MLCMLKRKLFLEKCGIFHVRIARELYENYKLYTDIEKITFYPIVIGEIFDQASK